MNSFTPSLTIKEWAKEDRPREKCVMKGIHTLSDAELLAVIIGSGTKQETVVGLAQRMLQSSGNNLNQLGKYSIDQLKSFYGIGEAKAISIAAALELGKRRKSSELIYRKKITCSEDIYKLFHPDLCDLNYEEFWILLLNRAHRVVEKMRISQGGISETTVDVRLIVRESINRLASGIVLCHNHPSGNKYPSKQDDQITHMVKKGASYFDIQVTDHIIVCDGDYFSYADENRLL